MDLQKDYIRKKLEELKIKTRPMDATPLIKFMLENSKKFDEGERKKFINDLEEGFLKASMLLLDRCFTEGVMTEIEYLEIKEKYHLEDIDFCTVLQAYYGKVDGVSKDDDNIIVATMDDSNIYKCKEFLFLRFGIDVKSIQECIVLMDKDKRNKVVDCNENQG